MTARPLWPTLSTPLVLVSLLACAAPTDLEKGPGDEAEIDLDEPSADSLRSPLLHGELVFGAANAARIGPQRYHAWEFSLTGDAEVVLWTGPAAEDGPIVDTVLALYRRRPNRQWGAAIARNDDHGGTLWSRVEVVDGAGEYRAIVRGYSVRTEGPFALFGACEGPGCPSSPEPEPEPEPGACHPAFVEAIRGCHADWLADPDFDPWTTSGAELMAQCADVEVVAPAWDALCLSPGAPTAICGEDLEAFASDHLASCRHELVGEVLDGTCIFGTHYRQIFGAEVPLVVRWQRTLRAGDTLDASERAQVIRAVRETAYDDVATVEEAFGVVDEGVIHQTSLWDASGRRAFLAYELGAGDNSFGAIFPLGSAAPAARIVDGDLYDCAVTWGPERRRCAEREPCAEGLFCNGADGAGVGRCLARAAADASDLGATCAADDECSESLVCAGASLGHEGLCNPAWMRGRFVSEPDLAIPDANAAGASATLRVQGLATVSTDVRVDLFIVHPRISDLRVVLRNPEGTEGVVFEGDRSGSELFLRGVPVRGFPGDERVNGDWTLHVTDAVRGSVGVIRSVGLELTSRWD